MRLKKCGKGVVIESGVHIVNSSKIEIEDHVWIDRNTILIAGEIKNSSYPTRIIENPSFKGRLGEIHIGSFSHIGIGTIIQGHGGVYIDRYCTTSAGCKIYSFSNDPGKCKTGTMMNTSYVIHPVMMEENVWLGLNAILLGHCVGRDTFIKPNSVIVKDTPEVNNEKIIQTKDN
ncbi:MAG: hypothetical protein IPP15_13980 [Saprospiraceae bacterium]|uniref:Acyltransferase n=1 Tax=Candidatus Opimibacter skivensis TaxID=2982028 RepID=A0A9D7XQX0_9BACT|nr:hypothetical protein [Candidatus Opimibacter skivensis]